MGALVGVAKPALHLVRVRVPPRARAAITAKNVPVAFGEWLFGYVRDDCQKPDPDTAIQVTAKWTCKPGEDALIIHETFSDTEELKFHLTKGTAEKFRKDIDKIAAREAHCFRGPVSWTIRSYSKSLHLPATY